MNTNSTIASSPPGVAPGMPDIQPIQPPLVLPDPLTWLWILLALLAVAIIGYVVWKKYFRKEPPAVPQIIIPPHDKARKSLQDAYGLIDQPQPFCFAVSGAVRVYLEERFNFHAPDRTTEEFLRELGNSNILLPDQKQSLGEFLSICDMVKFARYEPGREELKALFDSANRLIDETEPQPEPPVTNSPQGAA
jgi:hypothetical protein